MAEIEDKPKAVKKPQGLDRSVRHMGVFTDFRQREYPSYLEFQDTEDASRGFALFCVSTHKEFKPGLRVMDLAQIKAAKVNFRANGKTEAVDKPKAKAISKSARNKSMAVAPKAESEE